jgi:hypothetical protein
MKKIILTLLITATTLFTSAQSTIETYAFEVGNWNTYTKKWDWGQIKPCNVTFILFGNSIVSNDLAKSTYYTYQTITSEYPNASWKALDEKRRECMILMSFFETYSYFIVMYDNVCYRYTY